MKEAYYEPDEAEGRAVLVGFLPRRGARHGGLWPYNGKFIDSREGQEERATR